MNTNERFIQTFSHLHASADTWTEVKKMTILKQKSARSRLSRRALALALAAALLLALGATAYAVDLFGFRALLRPEKAAWDAAEYHVLSLTRPQDVPEGLDSAIAQRVANGKAAWTEWDAVRQGRGESALPPALAGQSADTHRIDFAPNADGGATARYWAEDGTLLAERALSAAEYAELETYNRGGVAGYDWHYDVQSAAEAAALEEIAAKYSLALRRESHVLWSGESTGQSGADFRTNAELAAMTAELGCAESLFYAVPAGFDKLYWYDEGTFAASYTLKLPSGARADCYACNAPYATLSSGREVVNWESDLSAFTQRAHTAPDGTELTLLASGADAYLYVYLKDSFFAAHISAAQPLSDADLDAAADALRYGAIGG